MKDWTEQLISDISELDNKCFNEMPLSILIETSVDDNGNRYFDCTVYTGFDKQEGLLLVDVIGVDSLSELFSELVKKWS